MDVRPRGRRNHTMCSDSCCGGFVVRRYYSRAERRGWLEGYAAELESELEAVRERIKDLGGEEE